MNATTIERTSTITEATPLTITEATPLTAAEQDTLIGMTAAAERPRIRRTPSAFRGWSMGGNVD